MSANTQKGVERIKTEAAADKLKFEVYEDNANEQRWRLKSANGQVVAFVPPGIQSQSRLRTRD